MRNLLELRTAGSILQRASQSVVVDPRGQRPLVLLFTWLEAEKKHVHKYGDFYLRRGYDVLNVYTSLRQGLRRWAKGFIEIGARVNDLLKSPGMRDRPIICHVFCVGTHFYLQTVTGSDAGLRDRIVAQIFDSPTDYWHMWPGGPMGGSVSNFLRNGSIRVYFATFNRSVTQLFIQRSQLFQHQHPVGAPSLFLHSRSDPVGALPLVEGIVHTWREKLGYDVRTKCFEDSHHVQHARRYPEEYWATVTDFLEDCKI